MMSAKSYILSLFLCLASSQLSAQGTINYGLFEKGDRFIKINPIAFTIKTFNLQYENFITDESSLYLGVARVLSPTYKETTYNGIVITPGFKHYVERKRDKVIGYIDFRLRFQYFKMPIGSKFYSSKTDRVKLKSLGFGVHFGKLYKITHEFFFEYWFGINAQLVSIERVQLSQNNKYQIPIIVEGINPNFGISLNYKLSKKKKYD